MIPNKLKTNPKGSYNCANLCILIHCPNQTPILLYIYNICLLRREAIDSLIIYVLDWIFIHLQRLKEIDTVPELNVFFDIFANSERNSSFDKWGILISTEKMDMKQFGQNLKYFWISNQFILYSVSECKSFNVFTLCFYTKEKPWSWRVKVEESNKIISLAYRIPWLVVS